MARSLVRSIVVAADADSVWSHIGAFDGLGTWHPSVPPAEIEGDPTQVGSIRTFSVDGRVVAREELVARDPRGAATATRCSTRCSRSATTSPPSR